ncbi:hypothetical protein [Bacillus aerolatus]|uniref:hypothetical protein n=1 Tax=Bacillus aerolatus TaxID=2653354 RepID=UPI0017872529|nr:hypothetical protein [Bacillus aerolatus]
MSFQRISENHLPKGLLERIEEMEKKMTELEDEITGLKKNRKKKRKRKGKKAKG